MKKKHLLLFLLPLILLQCKTTIKTVEKVPDHNDTIIMLKETANIVNQYLDTIGKAYQNGEYLTHAKLTSSLLYIMQRLPERFHTFCAPTISSEIKRKGILPYTSIVVDYAYRLSRFPTKSRLKTFNRFSSEIGHSTNIAEAEMKGTVLLSTDYLGNLRAYSANAGMATASLAISEVGFEVFSSGGSPEDILRILALAAICREQTSDGEMGSAVGMERCNELGDIVTGGLAEAGMGVSTIGQILGGLQVGFNKKMEICLNNQANANSMAAIAEMEQLNSCWERQVANIRTGGSVTPVGSLFEGNVGTDAYGHLLEEFLSGFNHTDTESDFTPHGSQIANSFRNTETAETVRVTEYAKVMGEDEVETGTHIHYEGPAGTTESFYGNDGNLLWTNFEGTGSFDGIYEHKEYYDNGNPKFSVTTNRERDEYEYVEYDEEGNVVKRKKGKLSEIGNEEQESTQHDWGVHPCGPDLSGDALAEELEHLTSELDPYIIPNPDGPISGFSSACLEAAVMTPTTKCSPSVALCIDPVFQQTGCDCGTSNDPPELPILAIQCFSINCGPDGECNPVTGTCQSEGDLGRLPDIWPPIIDLDLPPLKKPPKKKPDFLPE